MSSCETFSGTQSCQGTQFIVFWVLNLVAFLLLPITCIVSVVEYSHSWYDWISTYYYSTFYEPLTTDDAVMYILVSILIILSLFILALICLKGTVIKDAQFYDAFFNGWAKYIFIPVLITCAMFFIGNAHGDDRKPSLIVGLIFAILCVAGYIFIYLQLPEPGETWMLFIYKKCLISCLIVFHAYFVFYDICHIARINKAKDGEICSYIFMVILGILCAAGIWFFTEVMSGTFAWLLYVGFVAFSAEGGDNRKTLRRTGDLVISIIFMIGLLVEIVVVCVLKKRQVIQ